MPAIKDFVLLEEKIKYTFQNKTLIQNALTHSSFYNENRNKINKISSNERLEFLGDSILQIVISEYLFKEFPDSDEGELTQMRQQIVCELALAEAARSIELGEYLFLGKGDSNSGARTRDSVLSDAFEAVIAAIYIDSKETGISTVRKVILSLMRKQLLNCHKSYSDYKTQLQQLVQQDGKESLYYEVISESGPAHNRSFTVAAMLNSNKIGEGTGHTKREAEQKAAHEALLLFGIRNDENE